MPAASPEQSQESMDDAQQAQISADDMADAEMGEEVDLPEGEAPLEESYMRGGF